MRFIRMFLTLMAIVIGLAVLAAIAMADTVPEDLAVRCVVGEAEDQGIEGMTAVAEAIRNRGHVRGVYGCRSPRIAKAQPGVWELARWAWDRSEFTNSVKGADHWHSDREPRAWWEKYGTRTVKIGSHKFYKDVRR
ncbi:MAG: hypothetical protein KC897_11055 [Candidatus Omnitrophica bacterium]|nr:hypothetical protein [Candidatus Omnitrophota bacterium]